MSPMLKPLLVATMIAFAAPATAATFVQIDIAGEHSASFDIRKSPTPSSFAIGDSFVLNAVEGSFEGAAGSPAIRFFNDTRGGGLEIVGDFVGHYNQLYSGSESKPTIYTGDFQLIDASTGGTSGLIIFETAAIVPEASAWTMMSAGFGLSGALFRRRRRIVVAG